MEINSIFCYHQTKLIIYFKNYGIWSDSYFCRRLVSFGQAGNFASRSQRTYLAFGDYWFGNRDDNQGIKKR